MILVVIAIWFGLTSKQDELHIKGPDWDVLENKENPANKSAGFIFRASLAKI